MVEYSIVKSDHFDKNDDDRIHSEDGFGYFAINLPHQGQVTVNKTLDFEKTQRYYVTIVASVSILKNISEFCAKKWQILGKNPAWNRQRFFCVGRFKPVCDSNWDLNKFSKENGSSSFEFKVFLYFLKLIFRNCLSQKQVFDF